MYTEDSMCLTRKFIIHLPCYICRTHIYCYSIMELCFYLLVVLYNLHITEAVRAFKGSTVQLKCMFYADAGLSQRLIWRKGIKTLSENTILGNTDVKERLKITGDHSIGEYHMNISDIRKSDADIYTCSITKTYKVETQQLIVIVGPSAITIENVTTDNKILGIEGLDMIIKCTAVGGQPAPNIKLVILGSSYTDHQSAQHVFKPNSSYDGSTVTCHAGYREIDYYPLTTTADIHLTLKPVITPFSFDTLSTEETKSFDVSCQSTGNCPAVSIYWVLGPQRINVTTNSTTQTDHESSTDRYTVTSNIKYRVNRRYNGQRLICGAVNVAGNMETSLTLNVKYAPVVIVQNKTFSQTQSIRQIQSSLDSNPPVNTCIWHHRSKYGEHIRTLSENNQILTLPHVSENNKYQDTGEYACTAENGIMGINGQLEQTGSGYIFSNAAPVITADNKDNSTQYGMFGKSTKVYVNVYSFPKFSRISWYIGNTQLKSNKYAIKEESAIVKDVFHGEDVHLDGYRVTLTISDLQDADFTNYTLRLYYSSQYIQYEVSLESASAPETPSNFTITSSRETSITVQWIPGYDGGQTQIFYLQYRTSGTYAWVHQEIKNSNQLDSHNIYTLSGLQDKTSYELRMYAKNKFNQSQHTDIETTRTLMSEAQTSSNAVIGAIAGVLVVSLIVCATIISLLIFKKKKGKQQTKKKTGFYENSGFQNVHIVEEYEDVVSKSDTQQKQTIKTYESLGTKDAIDVYDDLENHKGLPSSKSTNKTYESLGNKDALEVYDDLDNHKGLPSSIPSVDHYEALSAQDKPNLYEELENEKGQTEKVYVNEAF